LFIEKKVYPVMNREEDTDILSLFFSPCGTGNFIRMYWFATKYNYS